MSTETVLNNYINNEWRRSSASEYLDVTNPATAEVLGAVPLSPRHRSRYSGRRRLRMHLSNGGAHRHRIVFSTYSN